MPRAAAKSEDNELEEMLVSAHKQIEVLTRSVATLTAQVTCLEAGLGLRQATTRGVEGLSYMTGANRTVLEHIERLVLKDYGLEPK